MRKSKAGVDSEDRKSSNDHLKLEYEDYLRNQHGLSERTIYHCWRFADRFMQFRFGGKTRDLSRITPMDIVGFMQHLMSRGKPFRDKTPPTHLRNFLPVPVQERKDQHQSHADGPGRCAKIWFEAAEAPNTGAGGDVDRCREDGHRNGPAQLCHGASSGPTWATRSGSHCDPD
jgi:hypothetical protein